ncbi:MAG: hypothetical protein HYY06_02090 [Deltaproteobacteria bacterium]|nr:hypothetical protein [Deltaproteobacteria bacterium]
MADERLAEPIVVTLEAVSTLVRLGIRYAIGGSLASSLLGRALAEAGLGRAR